MNIQKTFLSLCAAGVMSAATAAGFEAGRGVANDLATGANERDVTFVERGGNNTYGWRSYDTVLGATFLPWSVPNEESSVYGVRINLGWGAFVNTSGLDLGLFSNTKRDFAGISTSVFGGCAGESMKGIQVGLVNIVGGNAYGLQTAAVNVVNGGAYGLQVGAVNFAQDLHGVQIGVLNFNATGVACLPVLNIGF